MIDLLATYVVSSYLLYMLAVVLMVIALNINKDYDSTEELNDQKRKLRSIIALSCVAPLAGPYLIFTKVRDMTEVEEQETDGPTA